MIKSMYKTPFFPDFLLFFKNILKNYGKFSNSIVYLKGCSCFDPREYL